MAIRAARRADVSAAQPGDRARPDAIRAAASAICRPISPNIPYDGACGVRPRGVLRQRDRGAERAGYPPFGRLASLIISPRPAHAESFARRLAAIAPIDPRIQVLGPAEARSP